MKRFTVILKRFLVIYVILGGAIYPWLLFMGDGLIKVPPISITIGMILVSEYPSIASITLRVYYL